MDPSKIQLSDFLEDYPSFMTPKIQKLISGQAEFEELKFTGYERNPKRGDYFKHQLFTHRFLRNYNNLLLTDEPGTGKTCSVVGFLEEILKNKENYIQSLKYDPNIIHYNKFIILLKGGSQISQIIDQIICSCSDGHYLTDMIRNTENKEKQRKMLKKEIKNAGYIITTFKKFAKEVSLLSEEELKKKYHNTVFWVDEAHNLIVDSSSEKKDEKKFSKKDTYDNLWRLFHCSNSIKTILASATPMINDERDIISIMNLILPEKGHLPIDYDYKNAPKMDIKILFPKLVKNIPDYKNKPYEIVAPYFIGQMPKNLDIKNKPLEELEPFFRGKISYIRAAETGALPKEVGKTWSKKFKDSNGDEYESNLVLYSSEMSKFQDEAYQRAESNEKIEGDLSSNKKNKDIYIPVRSASNFVFPDGFWGNYVSKEEKQHKKRQEEANENLLEDLENELSPLDRKVSKKLTQKRTFKKHAFQKYVNYENGTFSATNEFKKNISSLEAIKKLSPKYASVIELIVHEPGNAFVYSEYLTGSGAIVLGLCLEHAMGVERYNESSSIFETSNDDNEAKDFCPQSGTKDFTVEKKERKAKIPKKLRYALYIDSAPEANLQSIMETMNSYENRHGDYIKIFITTRIGRDGINVNNVIQIHLLGSEWNQSTMYQAIYRGIRTTSHQDLVDEKKRSLMIKGEDISNVHIPIHIYKHASVKRKNPNNSIDIVMYRVAESKDRSIRKIMRYMKQCSVSCMLQHNRNVRSTDIDNSPECDYEKCDYSCVDGYPPKKIDYSNYNILYSDNLIHEIIEKISLLFKYNNIVTGELLEYSLSDMQPLHIYMALQEIIQKKIRFLDKYGYICYVKDDHGMFFLDRAYPNASEIPSVMNAYYTNYLIGSKYVGVKELIIRLQEDTQEDIIEKIYTLNPKKNKENIESLFSTLNIDGKAMLVESAIVKHLENPTPLTEFIIQLLKSNIYHFREPITILEKAREAMVTPTKIKRGRKPKLEKEKNIKDLLVDGFPKEKNSEYVWIQTVYSEETARTAYAATAKFNKKLGKKRILKPSENTGWRDIEGVELQVYNEYIKSKEKEKAKKFEEKGYYGIILPDGKFRIRDPKNESERAKKDERLKNRGEICTTWNRAELIDVAWEIGVSPPPLEEKKKKRKTDVEEKLNKKAYIEFLKTKNIKHSANDLKNWKEDRCLYYYQWYAQSKKWTREVICNKIQEKMAESDRILV